jgi:hypothetical protein
VTRYFYYDEGWRVITERTKLRATIAVRSALPKKRALLLGAGALLGARKGIRSRLLGVARAHPGVVAAVAQGDRGGPSIATVPGG